jgi:RNAse (barnase) inhibitor barstar
MAQTDIRPIVRQASRGAGAGDAHLVQAGPLGREQIPALCQGLRDAGFWVGVIDAGTLGGRGALLTALAEAFRFPGYFGHNWDAVIDCLSDMSWVAAGRWCCVLVQADALRAADARLFETFLQACDSVARRLKGRPGTGDFRLILC